MKQLECIEAVYLYTGSIWHVACGMDLVWSQHQDAWKE